MELKRHTDFLPLNESVLPKDLARIENIVKKSKGDKESMMKYVNSMANAIKDKHKAFQRGKAADEILNYPEAGEVFFKRAQELGLDFDINVERSRSGMSKFGITIPKLGSLQSQPHEEPQKNKWNENSILPIGSVNLQNDENEYFNVIEDGGVAEIWKDEKGNFKMVLTSGDRPTANIGWTGDFRHDQTWANIGRNWELVEWVQAKDLTALLRVLNKTKLRGYVYK